MPNYVARMWLRGKSEDSAVAALYGPSKATYRLSDGTLCTIREETQYPFGDDVEFTFSFSRNGRKVRSHNLNFSFRIPEGCTLDGDDYDSNAGGFRTISKAFRNGERLELHFNAAPVLKETEGGVYVQRGTLVFSLPIQARVEVDTVTYSYMNGKVPNEPGFDCLNLTPTGSWRWSLSPSASPEFVRIEPAGGYPFENPPVAVTVPATAVSGWDLAEGIYTTEAPDTIVKSDTAPEELTLIPYGCTLLRLTVFPVLIERFHQKAI